MIQASLLTPNPSTVGACAFGLPDYDWFGRHHCASCDDAVREAVTRMAEARSRGEFDADGYTPAERRAQERRAA